ncbi:RNA polymerase sigma factor [Chitinophaga sp. 22321]|uniref:RNA polymerase sigma factor n=1 Tax=Chitinophaga hostae TaxID=2831022 RepID=A0ABS5J5X3_9BACT|nr:RNA polymerase sigma factor [Chitinophaga hostae]MBS0030620.1 RNA polymerase sigma factor [Chitinophaga hostae]
MTTQQEEIVNHITNEELIRLILAGDKAMFGVLIRRYNQRLYRIGMSILENSAETEDAMQNTYLNAYHHLSQFEHRASWETWLTRIMLNQCYELKRKNKSALTHLPAPDKFIDMNTPARDLANKELSQVLERAIGVLPDKYRLVFVLREVEEMSVRETAEVLEIGESNVKVRLNRAKAMLREHLNDYMKDHVYHFHLTRCDRIVQAVFQQLEDEE